MFFDSFPNIGYKIDDEIITTTDIFRRVAPLKTFLDNDTFMEHYRLTAGERPEDVAFALYKDPELHWTILLTNNIVLYRHLKFYQKQNEHKMICK